MPACKQGKSHPSHDKDSITVSVSFVGSVDSSLSFVVIVWITGNFPQLYWLPLHMMYHSTYAVGGGSEC